MIYVTETPMTVHIPLLPPPLDRIARHENGWQTTYLLAGLSTLVTDHTVIVAVRRKVVADRYVRIVLIERGVCKRCQYALGAEGVVPTILDMIAQYKPLEVMAAAGQPIQHAHYEVTK